MDVFDITLLGALCCLIGVAVLFRHRRALQVGVVIFLLLTICFSVLSLNAFAPRLAASLHEREGGKWSEAFRDGVVSVTHVSRLYHPYRIDSRLNVTGGWSH